MKEIYNGEQFSPNKLKGNFSSPYGEQPPFDLERPYYRAILFSVGREMVVFVCCPHIWGPATRIMLTTIRQLRDLEICYFRTQADLYEFIRLNQLFEGSR